MSFSKDASIVAQASAHDASAMVAALITAGVVADVDSAIETAERIQRAQFDVSMQLATATTVVEGMDQGGPRGRRNNGGGGNRAPQQSEPATVDADPGAFLIRQGKHKGKTIAQVHEEAPTWLDWCVEKMRPEDAHVVNAKAYLASMN